MVETDGVAEFVDQHARQIVGARVAVKAGAPAFARIEADCGLGQRRDRTAAIVPADIGESDAAGAVLGADDDVGLLGIVDLTKTDRPSGFRVAEADAPSLVWGYACGLDMTRRDLQRVAREAGKPWDLAKNFEGAAVLSGIVPKAGADVLQSGAITLQVNGLTRQSGNLAQLIWSIPELIADLSRFYHLQPGDLIFTGTPEGVSAVVPGDRLTGRIEGVGEITLTIGEAE